ncbi:TetR/AcrR family transcriptional regulator [Spongiactinospora rosea]|uniref:TetR/AcrR family transcriptional regulator n=1 Tax=Spongiactinospora rosea TaxID=2248750 RepID=A0A366M7H9_9ACTN|nr:TetR/AcrR family transcriptional regulator [Spongiactinospora rosea]RBQ21499.1 TetR/AcrR family transcriptional regulator [Spongiactinospora rosea]
MASKRDWLDTGLEILARDGARALTIERLCGELDLTKGSFYHHFKGITGYQKDLLGHFETEHTDRFITAVEGSGEPAPARLRRLLDIVLDVEDHNAGLESAVRAWALVDADVRAVQERVDRTRIDYLSALWRDLGGPESDVTPMGRLLYLILIGGQQVIPPISAPELRDIYQRALRLAPPEEADTE